ncbi:MAG: cyclic nucleotide-binding domain-containing protein [Nitratireductor sp.]
MELTLESALSTGGLVGHLSYFLLVISMMMNRLSLLRVLVIASALTAIVYDWVWLRDPVGVFWETLLVTVNIIQLLILYWKNTNARFSDDELAFVRGKFPGLAKGKSRQLLNLGNWQEADNGTIITTEGVTAGRLTYISRGSVDVVVDGKRVAQCQPGDFIGEMTVLNGEPASATTLANGGVHLWQIEAEALRRILSRNPEIERELEASFARNYRDKLVHTNSLIAKGIVP